MLFLMSVFFMVTMYISCSSLSSIVLSEIPLFSLYLYLHYFFFFLQIYFFYSIVPIRKRKNVFFFTYPKTLVGSFNFHCRFFSQSEQACQVTLTLSNGCVSSLHLLLLRSGEAGNTAESSLTGTPHVSLSSAVSFSPFFPPLFFPRVCQDFVFCFSSPLSLCLSLYLVFRFLYLCFYLLY